LVILKAGVNAEHGLVVILVYTQMGFLRTIFSDEVIAHLMQKLHIVPPKRLFASFCKPIMKTKLS